MGGQYSGFVSGILTRIRATLGPNHAVIAILIAVALLYVAFRVPVIASSSHLIFPHDRAEYGHVFVAARFLHEPWYALVFDARSRTEFLEQCRAIGDRTHGTLAMATFWLRAVVSITGLDLSTGTLKLLALANSTLALLLWCVALIRAVPGRQGISVLAGFAALFTLCPNVLLKISTVFWGTHDYVILIHALLMALFLPMALGRVRPRRSLAVAVGLGAVTAAAALANVFLLLPMSFLLLWTIGSIAVERGRTAGRRIVLRSLLAMAVAAAGTALVVVQLAFTSGILDGIGYPSSLLAGGESFLFNQVRPGTEATVYASGGGRIMEMFFAPRGLWYSAMPLWPGPVCSPAWKVFESLTRIGVLGLALWLVVSAWRSARGRAKEPRDDNSARRMTTFLAAYLLVGWGAVTLAGLGTGVYSEEPTVVPRYYAHLYPVTLAMIASWCLAGARWRIAVLLVLLGCGFTAHTRHVDPGNLGSLSRYDGVPLFSISPGAGPGLPLTPGAWAGFESMSPSFVRGYAFLEMYQRYDYWSYVTPATLDERPLEPALRGYILGTVPSIVDSDEFYRGIGYALRLLFPPQRRGEVEPAVGRLSAGQAQIWKGYELAPLTR